MEFSRSEDFVAIQELARQIFADKATDAALRAFDRGETGFDRAVWAQLGESGLIGVALPEEFSGSGMGFQELCAVLEEQGRHVLAQPLLAATVLGALPLAQFGSAARKERWLKGVATGSTLLSGWLPAPDAPGFGSAVPQVRADGAGFRLDGELAFVPYAQEAHALLVPATDAEGGWHWFVLPTSATGLSIDRQRGTNHEPLDAIRFEGVLLGADDRLPADGAAVRAWIAERASTALAFLQLGVVNEDLRRTAKHTVERKQFGKPLAGFQAVAHRAADGYIDIEALRGVAWQAAWRIDQGLPAADAAASAAWWACEAGHRVGHSGQHMHGGTGADLDYPIHRYFLWAKQIEMNLGGGSRVLASLGASVSQQRIEIGL